MIFICSAAATCSSAYGSAPYLHTSARRLVTGCTRGLTADCLSSPSDGITQLKLSSLRFFWQQAPCRVVWHLCQRPWRKPESTASSHVLPPNNARAPSAHAEL